MLHSLRHVVLNKRPLVATLIPSGFGTNFTNASARTGNFSDGNTAQDDNNCTTTNANTQSAGKDFGSPLIIHSAIIYGSTNVGFANNAGGAITFDIRGSNSAVVTYASDGVLLGTLSTTDPDNATPRTVSVIDITTSSYRYAWINMTVSGAVQVHFCEIQFYQAL